MVLTDGKFGQAILSGCSMACIWGFKHDYMKDRRSGLYYKGETSCMIYPHTVRCAQHCRATIMGHPRIVNSQRDFHRVVWKSQLSLALITSPKCNAPDNVVKESMSFIPLLVPPQPAPSHVELQPPPELQQLSRHNLGSWVEPHFAPPLAQ